MRLFVAVDIAAPVREAAARLIDELRLRVQEQAPQARLTWVSAERMHLTLRFIGDVDAARAPAVAASLAPPIPANPFEVTFAGAAAFSERRAPRVIWTAVTRGADQLAALAAEVGARLAAGGLVADERQRFTPHLTLARVRQPSRLTTVTLLDGLGDRPIGTSTVDTITLYESRLSPKGPAYVPLQRTPLRGR